MVEMWLELKLVSVFVIASVIVSLASCHSLNTNREKRQTNVIDVPPVEYLRRYGYLRDHYYTSNVAPNSEELTEAFKIYQNYLRLPITGSVNPDTQSEMNKPRCGCNDVFAIWMNQTTQDRVKRFARYTPVNFNARTGWRRTDLTWQLLGSTRARIPSSVVRSEIRRAFALWAAETPLTFREVNSNPDIEIDFNVGAHGDGSPFDGPSGVLAHAFFPELGTTHFDDREQWTTNSTTRSGIDLFIVAAHEFGHALGLDHSNVRDALMFPTYLGYIPDFKLNTDDIRGIRSIYGGPPTPRTTRAPTIPTTRPTTRATTRPTRGPTTLRPRPTVPTTLPFQCRRTFGAAFEDDNGDLMMIRGIFLYRIPVYDPRTGSAAVSRASNMFQRVMSFPDAIFQVPGSTYVIRRRRVQQFSRPDGTLLGPRVRVADTWNGLGGLPRGARITAAVAITQNEVLLFGRFRGQGYVWEYDVFNKDIIQSSMTLMQEAFPGIPPIVDMALSRDPIEIIFVAGQEYFRYDTESQEVAGPFAFAPAFVGGSCGREEI